MDESPTNSANKGSAEKSIFVPNSGKLASRTKLASEMTLKANKDCNTHPHYDKEIAK